LGKVSIRKFVLKNVGSRYKLCGGYGFYYKQPKSCLCLTRNHEVAYNRYMNNNKDTIFKALGDSTRRLMLDELSERNEQTLYELTVRLITKHELSITRQAIAKHLAVLEDAGLVKSEKKGKYRVLIFNNEPLKNLLEGWIE
jgi:DNA-binding transcriptional ArsR family regulator